MAKILFIYFLLVFISTANASWPQPLSFKTNHLNLKVQVLNDELIHFELYEIQTPFAPEELYTTPYVDRKNLRTHFNGPTNFQVNGNIIETSKIYWIN